MSNSILLGQPTLGGMQGPPGTDGQDGASTYEIAVANGFVGTEQDWLDSLEARVRARTVLGYTDNQIITTNTYHTLAVDVLHDPTGFFNPATGTLTRDVPTRVTQVFKGPMSGAEHLDVLRLNSQIIWDFDEIRVGTSTTNLDKVITFVMGISGVYANYLIPKVLQSTGADITLTNTAITRVYSYILIEEL